MPESVTETITINNISIAHVQGGVKKKWRMIDHFAHL